ncbi:hypothetical protein ACLOJK_012319 [Asimina triloba]
MELLNFRYGFAAMGWPPVTAEAVVGEKGEELDLMRLNKWRLLVLMKKMTSDHRSMLPIYKSESCRSIQRCRWGRKWSR